MVDRPSEVPALVGVEVREYKNLVDLWLPWSDGIATFGVNGAGKTTLGHAESGEGVDGLRC